jgi:AmmeMemoRadiSam system protein B
MRVRPAAVAGTWYPGTPQALRTEVERHLAAADSGPGAPVPGRLRALIVPHAGLIYSGGVAAHAYCRLPGEAFDVIVLVGPSHYVPFDGVSIIPAGACATPLGPLRIEESVAAALLQSGRLVRDFPDAHRREHSLELQFPFLAALTPSTPIVPIVMGHQSQATAVALADAMVQAIGGRRALLVASSDLSHFHERSQAARLDAAVIERIDAFDADGLMSLLEREPGHACGGGPIVAVLRAARGLGAATADVIHYADSGHVSGDTSSVVGYLAAVVEAE